MTDSEYLSSKLTIECIKSALDKIRASYETEGSRLEIITNDRYNDVIDIMANHFTPDEPLCNAFDVVWEENFERVVRELLKENLSVMMVSEADNRVMGVRINGVMKPTDSSNSEKVTYEPLKELFAFLAQKDEELKFFERFQVKEAMHFFSLGVHKDFRRRGLGTKLLQACVGLSKELGFTVIKGEATSNYTQRIYEKEGFECLIEIPYDNFIHNGEPLCNKTGPHTRTKVLAKVL